MKELKPCPFCGARDDKVELWDNTSDIIWEHAYQVLCCNCWVRTSFYKYKEEAIKTWNRRVE